MSKIIFPLQFERQYSGPLDVNQIFDLTADRVTYLTNPLRYAGQLVSDLQDGKTYKLNSSLNAWDEVGSNLSSLTATNIFANNLTVTNTVSASYFKGVILDWMTLTRGYKITPVFNSSISTGDVYDYVYSTSSTDKTYYRYIATDGSEDAYYENFSGGILSNLIVKKQIIL
jgi:hypothetical protein